MPPVKKRSHWFKLLLGWWALSLIGSLIVILSIQFLNAVGNEYVEILGLDNFAQSPILVAWSIGKVIIGAVLFFGVIYWQKWAVVGYLPVILISIIIDLAIESSGGATLDISLYSLISSLIFPTLVFICLRKNWGIFG